MYVSFIFVKHISIIGLYDITINIFAYQSRLIVLMSLSTAATDSGCMIYLYKMYKQNNIRINTTLQHAYLFILIKSYSP
jgi:hypothetical protein